MPSIKIKHTASVSLLSKSVLLAMCASLAACGGSGGATTRTTDSSSSTNNSSTTTLAVTTHIPLQVNQAKLVIQVVGEDTPLLEDDDFSGFNASISDLSSTTYKNKIVHVSLSGDSNSTMYDPILNSFVKFDGELNAIGYLQSGTLNLELTPASEAIYQRTLVRSGNIDTSVVADLTLVQNKHITKSSSEVYASLNQAFNVKAFPDFNTSLSIRNVSYTQASKKEYINTFTGLGLLKLWVSENPKTVNSYLELAESLGVDLRDGSLDGRSINGDSTAFTALVTAPRNVDPALNSLLGIGATQKTTRENFGAALKAATLDYAKNLAYQTSFNPTGYEALEDNNYYTIANGIDTTSHVRWNGAGDYRRAFGIATTATCQNITDYPCKQGLNADDIDANYSDIEYLIGTHQVGSCKVEVFPDGVVNLTKGSQIYTASINRDISDNLLQLSATSKDYIVNIGNGETNPPYFMQLEVKNATIIDAKTGYATDFYPVELSETEASCS